MVTAKTLDDLFPDTLRGIATLLGLRGHFCNNTR